MQGGRAVATPVRLGERGTVGGEPWIEIVAGLAEGTPVLAATAGLVRDGTAVRLAGGAKAPALSAPKP